MSEPDGAAFNHGYLIDRASAEGARILDYGCGQGEMVALGLSRGLDIWGADAYSGPYEFFASSIDTRATERIGRIESGRAPFADGSFDVVVSNQVLEHVEDPGPFLDDIQRLLRPGGALIAAFPVRETWYEGHVRLFFVHWLPKGSTARRVYLGLCHRLGLGYEPSIGPPRVWVNAAEEVIDDTVFYRARAVLFGLIAQSFGEEPECLAAASMRARLGARAAHVPALADPLLRAVYKMRAGEILRIRKRT